jgi:Sulfatase-modifying factor enzyme 1
MSETTPVKPPTYQVFLSYSRVDPNIWLHEKTGDPDYRLPSEAQWEYAARGGEYSTPYWWGTTLGKEDANCAIEGSEFGGTKTAPVDSFKQNRFGLYNTAGNVWEWVQDAWHDNYESPVKGAAGKADERSVSRVLRGGSWNNHPRNCRAANRNHNDPDNRNNNIGFRVCRVVHIVINPEKRSGRCRNFRPTMVCRTRPGVIDGAGKSRPHAAMRRRAHSENGRRLDKFPRRPP